MNRCIVIITAIILYSCADKPANTLKIFEAAEESLLQSDYAIFQANNSMYGALEEKLSMPETAEMASKWEPKAILIGERSTAMVRYLDSLIPVLKKEAGIQLVEMKEVYKEDDVEAVRKLFINKNVGKEIYEKLKKYKMDMLAVDPYLNKEFAENLIIISNGFENVSKDDFNKTFFDGVPAIAAIVMLRKFENNVRVLENKFITYCYNQIGTSGWRLHVFAPLVSQNGNQFKKGDKIKIVAGIGAYYSSAKPTISINGKIFKTLGGVADYESKTPLKAGSYSIPVKIEYFEPGGSKKFFETKVEYTVVE
ncbi:hypothetical protein [Ferruginibacter sp.]